jgi:hypothetical protein
MGERSGLPTRTSDDGKRFVVHADEKLTAFLELESETASQNPVNITNDCGRSPGSLSLAGFTMWQ